MAGKNNISSFMKRNRLSGWLFIGIVILTLFDIYLRGVFPGQTIFGEEVQIELILAFPIFATISLFTRQFVGIETFGLFGPAVLGISLYQIGVFQGLALYGGMLAIGIIANYFLRKYRTLTSARINLTLFLTVLIILPFILLRNASINQALVFFPMLITVHIMERFSTTLENNDFETALEVLLSTLLGACLSGIAGLLMFYYLNLLGFVFFFFLALAFALLVSTYSGLRLIELARFKFHGTRE